jgi:hypothetical protein
MQVSHGLYANEDAKIVIVERELWRRSRDVAREMRISISTEVS